MKKSDNFQRILFSSFIQKMNRSLKNQLRAIALTDSYLYRLDPVEGYKLKKEPIPIKDIISATITEEPEYQLVILKIRNSESDFVFYIETKDNSIDKVPELIANIHRARIK